MESGSFKCLKYLMFFFNLLFFLCGAGTLSIGIWATVGAQSFKDILVDNDLIFNGVYIIIGVGGALFLMGFLGCCGAVKESKCLLGMFFGFVAVIFTVEVVGAVLVFVYLPKVEEYAKKSMDIYGADDDKAKLVKQGWDTFQATVSCCGYNNYTEWKNSTGWSERVKMKIVPASCCKRNILTKESAPIDEKLCQEDKANFINREGCNTKLGNYIWIAGGVGIGILVFELLGMIFACCLLQSIEK